MFGHELMQSDSYLVTDILAYEDAMRRREIAQMYQEISMLHKKLRYMTPTDTGYNRSKRRNTTQSYSDFWKNDDLEYALEEEAEYGSGESTSRRRKARQTYTENPRKKTYTTAAGTDLIHGLNKELGIYFCKHCEVSWPCSFFRNTQQFGAHCSNCSRQRQVKHPNDLNVDGEESHETPILASPRKRRDRSNESPRKRKKSRKIKKVDSTPSKARRASAGGTPSNGRKIKHGCDKVRGIYYCKHCETSWPMDYFRNPQQFGAHCSNCSRQRQVREPSITTAAPLVPLGKGKGPMRSSPVRKAPKPVAPSTPKPVAARPTPVTPVVPVSPVVAAAAAAIVSAAPASLVKAQAAASAGHSSPAPKPALPMQKAALPADTGMDSDCEEDEFSDVIGLASTDDVQAPASAMFKSAPSSHAIVDELFGSAALFS